MDYIFLSPTKQKLYLKNILLLLLQYQVVFFSFVWAFLSHYSYSLNTIMLTTLFNYLSSYVLSHFLLHWDVSQKNKKSSKQKHRAILRNRKSVESIYQEMGETIWIQPPSRTDCRMSKCDPHKFFCGRKKVWFELPNSQRCAWLYIRYFDLSSWCHLRLVGLRNKSII